MDVAEKIQGWVQSMARTILETVHLLLEFGFTKGVEHFNYSLRLTTGTADAIGTAYTGSVRISQEAAFCITSMQCVCRRQDTGVVIGMFTAASGAPGDLPDFPYLIQITDGGSDRLMHDEQIDAIAAYSTWGALRWPIKKRMLRNNSNVTVALTSLKQPGGQAWDLQIVLTGFKLYGVSDPRQVALELPLRPAA